MTYAMSDLHGCRALYESMLTTIRLKEQDTLYILGDVVDRGEGGIAILQDMMHRENVIPLRGNHDFLAHYLLKRHAAGQTDSAEYAEWFPLWIQDGGTPTLSAFAALSPAEKMDILAYLNTFLLYDEVEAGGNTFFLAHTVPDRARMQRFDRLLWQEFIIGEPEYDKEYFPDRFVVTGHTPTGLIDSRYAGRIYRQNRHIALDCGAVFGHALGCICLDTGEEFYVR